VLVGSKNLAEVFITPFVVTRRVHAFSFRFLFKDRPAFVGLGKHIFCKTLAFISICKAS
jgi:hypothetical protein